MFLLALPGSYTSDICAIGKCLHLRQFHILVKSARAAFTEPVFWARQPAASNPSTCKTKMSSPFLNHSCGFLLLEGWRLTFIGKLSPVLLSSLIHYHFLCFLCSNYAKPSFISSNFSFKRAETLLLIATAQLSVQFSSVQLRSVAQSCLTLGAHGLQHARPLTLSDLSQFPQAESNCWYQLSWEWVTYVSISSPARSSTRWHARILGSSQVADILFRAVSMRLRHI